VPLSVWFALFLGTAGVFADMYTTQSILPVLGRAFRLAPATAGLTVSAVVLAVAAGSLVAGPLSDRIGRKPVMVGASAILVVPTLLCGLAPSFGALVVFRALQGLFMPGLTSVMIVYVNEQFAARWRGTAMGVYVSGQVLGGLLARFASATLTGLLSWRPALAFFAIPTAGGALALARYLPSAPPTAGRLGARWADVGTHLRNRRLVAICVIGFGLFFGFIGTFTYLPYYLTGAPFRVPPASLGLVYLVWGMGIFSPVAGALSARVGRRRAIAASMALACCGMLVTLIGSLPVVVLGLALLAVGMFTTIPSVNLLIGEVTTVAKGTASAMYLCVYYLGGSVGAVVPGLLWQRFAWPGVVGICLAMALIALAANALSALGTRKAAVK
jgi:YNFM family putative membrane transporter